MVHELDYGFKDLTLQDKYKDMELVEMDKMSELKGNKTCGYDCIPVSVVKIMFNSYKSFFLELFNKIWINGKLPNTWKITNILFPKDPRNRDSYRPVSLLPIWSKVMDKLITNRLICLKENRILNDYQFEFRRNRTETDALQLVKDCIVNIINKKNREELH